MRKSRRKETMLNRDTPYGQAIHIAASRTALNPQHDRDADAQLIGAATGTDYNIVRRAIIDHAIWLVHRWIDAGDHDVAADGPHWLCPHYRQGLDAREPLDT